MMDNISNENDGIIRDMFSELNALAEYDSSLESKIMDRVDVEPDHSLILAKYKKWSRLGFMFSVGLISLLLIISFSTIADNAKLKPEAVGIQHLIPSLFAFIGLILIFVQIEIKKQVNLIANL